VASPEADELTAELTASYWRAHDQRLAETSFLAMARQLPGLIGHAVRLGWQASRRDTVATIALNLLSGVLTGVALLATTGVLEALLAAGPTPQRRPYDRDLVTKPTTGRMIPMAIITIT
jgi:ATP-binding cassette, subfamily B, bacterial